MRISSGLLLGLSLVACGAGEQGELPADAPSLDPLEAAEADARQELAESGRLYCALGGESEYRLACTLDRTPSDEGLILTVRHPDGGFRRLLVTSDGRGVIAADGAEPAIVTPRGEDQIEVAIADDAYLLPATVR